MVAVAHEATGALVGESVSRDPDTLRRVAAGLSRQLAADGFDDGLFEALEDVLTARPRPVSGHVGLVDRVVDAAADRLGLPPRPPRYRPRPAAMPQDEVDRLDDRFRRATARLVQVLPHRVASYPTETVQHLLAVRDEHPAPGAELARLRRFALALLDLLDLMGDTPTCKS